MLAKQAGMQSSASKRGRNAELFYIAEQLRMESSSGKTSKNAEQC